MMDDIINQMPRMEDTLSPTPTRRVQRVRYELRRREVQVARVTPLGPAFVAVTFVGDDLRGFVSGGFDDHVKFVFADEAGEEVRRDYTPRRFDAAKGELTIEFALHGHGAASRWAQRAEPGHRAAIGGPRGSMIIPTDYDWHLLAGDASALPAIHRRVEELPAGARALVVLQAEPADRRLQASAAQVDWHWVASPEQWLASLQRLPWPAGSGYAWCAGEASVMARARDVLLVERSHPRVDMRVAAYWKRGASSFHEEMSE